ncbi:MAG: hypothetical protein HGA80_00545, partial [Candidatus Omnitrophica bacterium]|nr:hypothetical protein [Candidatus Omnitrophota bacterium]
DEAAPVYEQALALYKHREFVEANKKFMQVQVLSPGFRDTAVYLSRLERDIKIQQEQTARLEQLRKADELYTQALKLYAEHKFTEAKTKLLETAAVDSNYKDLHSYLGHIDKDIGSEAGLKERQSVEQRAEGPYSQAVTLYHERKFALAKEKFIETAKIMPDYKKVRSYIARIDQDISDETSKSQRTRIEKAAVLYRDAQSLLSGHQFKEAFVKLAELEVVCPDYKDTRKRTEEVKALLVLNGIPVPEVTAAPVNTETPSSDGLSEEQIFALYKEAVSRYKAQDYPEARKLFEKISKARLQYRSTAKYLQSIDAIVGTQEKPNAAEQPAVRVKQGTPDAAAGEAKKAQVVQAEKLYREAVEFFKAGKYTEAKVKFEEAEALAPGYKSARHYIALSTKAQEKLAQPAAVRSQEKPASAAVSKAQSGQNSDMLRALAKRSEEIYNQIKKLAQDKDMASTQQTFEQVDRIISRLEKDQQRMAAEVEARQRREQEEGIRQKQVEKTTEIRNARKAQAETKQLLEAEKQKMTEAEHVRLGDLKDKEKEKARQEQKAFDDKVEALYQKALEAARNKQYAVAREAFTEITSVRPNYKDSIKVLTRIDREEGEARLVEYENKDRETVTALVERATVINMESVRLIEAGNYDEVHKKFDELGGILREVQNIKKTMLTRRREFSERWEKRMAQTRASGVASQRSPDKVVADVDSGINSAKARAVFQEGEKLYAAQNYSEAKAKFVEASCIDPKLQAAVTYITRINRIQEKQDFESQKERNKMQARILERKEESPKEAAAVDASASVSAAADRTKHLLDSGLELYRTRRYREARIKFEELQQIGDARQCKQAKHYLASIETILQKEKAEAEKERQAEHERYLRERRAQDIGTGQKPKTPVATGVTPSLTRAERDQEIQRQQELRAIEQQNAIERKQALSGSMAQEGQTAMSTNVEQSQKVQSVVTDVQPVLNGEKSITCTKFEENAVTVPVKGTKICKISFKSQGEKTHASAAPCRPRALRTVKDNDALEMNAYKARIQKEKVRLEKQEAVQRKADEKKREHLMQDTNVLDKVRVEEGRKKKAQIAAIESPSGSKPTAVAVPLQSGAAVKPLSASDTQEASLRLSIENGKRALQQQREAIRRDFEDGVERLYTDAVDLFKKRLYEEARQEFLQVADMIQGYKKTDYYLGQISRVLKVDSQNLASQAPNPIPHSSQTSSQVLAEAKRIQAISRELDAVEQQVHR